MCPASPCLGRFRRLLRRGPPPTAACRKSEPSPRHPYPLLRQVDRTSGTGCYAVDVVTSQRMRRAILGPVDGHDQTGGLQKGPEMRRNLAETCRYDLRDLDARIYDLRI